MFVSAGMVSRLNGSNERRAKSIGDIEVASSSRVSSRRRFELVGREAIGQRGKLCRRLIEPQPAEQFAELFRMFHPRRLPRDFFDQIGLLPQPRRQFACQSLRRVGVRRAERDNQFARVREMLLVKFQSLDGRLVRRAAGRGRPRQNAAAHRPRPTATMSNTHHQRFKKTLTVRESPPSFHRCGNFPAASCRPACCSKCNGVGSGFPASAAGK